MKKQIKKTVKPVNKTKKELFVNFCDINDIDDLYFYFALGKTNAGISINRLEFESIYKRGLNDAYTIAIDFVNVLNNTCNTFSEAFDKYQKMNLPWYKKLWNKITKPFKKNK